MIENILPEDTLETGFRTKANNAFDEIINNDPFIEDGVVKFPKHGGSEWTMDLSTLYYTKDQVLDQLSPYDQYATESLSGRVMRATFDMLAIGTDTTRYTSTAGVKWMIENTATLIDDYTIGVHNFEFGNVYLKADGNTNVGVNVYDGTDAIIASINSKDTGWELLSEQNEYKANLDFSNLVADVNIDLSNLATTSLSGSWNLGGNALDAIKDIGSTTNYNWNLIHNENTIATVGSSGIGIGTTSPLSKLHTLVTTAESLTEGANSARLYSSATGTGTAGVLGANLIFGQRWFNTSDTIIRTGGLSGIKTAGDGNFGGGVALLYQTADNVALSVGAVLQHDGYFGIGTTTPSYKLDVVGTGHFSGAVTFDTVPSSLQDATSANHLVRYSQWIASTSIKYLPTAVKTVSLTNITLSGTQTINGVALIAGDRILVAGQTTGANNGVYVVDASIWTRASDSDTDAELRGFIVSISGGTYTGYKYINTNTSTITVGTTAITYAEFSNNIEIDPVFTAWRDQERTANTIWAAPIGVNGAATWRALSVALGSQVTGVLPIANGGTGSSTQNFVDLTTTQTVGGLKTFSGALTAQSITASTGSLSAQNFSAYGITYNTLDSSMIQSGQQMFFNFKPLVFRASQYAFDRGNVVIGGNTGGLPTDFAFGTERLQVNGNIRYNNLLKPNNVAGTNGQVLATNGTQDAWKTLTVSDISDIASTYQPILPSGTSGQFLVKDSEGDLNFMDLKIRPIGLSLERIAVGNTDHYLGEQPHFLFKDKRHIQIARITDNTKQLNIGLVKKSNNGFIEQVGGSLNITATGGLYMTDFATPNQPLRMLTIDSSGKLSVSSIAGGGTAQSSLASTHIGFGINNVLGSSSNFKYLEDRYLQFTGSSANVNIGATGSGGTGFVESVNGNLLLQARSTYGVIVDVGFFQVDALGGGGTKMVVVDNDGKFATQTIPSGGSSQNIDQVLTTGNTVDNKTIIFENTTQNYFLFKEGSSATVGGISLETDSADYLAMSSNTGYGILIDSAENLLLLGNNTTIGYSNSTSLISLHGMPFNFNENAQNSGLGENGNEWGSGFNQGSPQAGDRMLFFYDGTRWVPSHVHTYAGAGGKTYLTID